MGFFETAYHAAAAEYGRSRAESYGRWAKIMRALQLLAVVALALGVGYLWASR